MKISGASSTVQTLPELPDYLTRGLKVVFVGFNPSVYSAAAGHYYARPANQFWRCLNGSGLLPGGISLGPQDDWRLPEFGLGVTDVVKRPTRSCSDLRASDYKAGVKTLSGKLERCSPEAVAFNGKGVFEAFQRFRETRGLPMRPVSLGPQAPANGGTRMFVLPSTSPINARLSLGEKLAYFRRLAEWVHRDA